MCYIVRHTTCKRIKGESKEAFVALGGKIYSLRNKGGKILIKKDSKKKKYEFENVLLIKVIKVFSTNKRLSLIITFNV